MSEDRRNLYLFLAIFPSGDMQESFGYNNAMLLLSIFITLLLFCRFVDDILDQRRDGIFLECGSADGEALSNSLFFERECH